MRDCISLGCAPYTGRMTSSALRPPGAQSSALHREYSTSHAVSISSCPVRKSRMSPAGSDRWMFMMVSSAASR